MRRIDPSQQFEQLHDTLATRAIERSASALLPPYTLMARAGLAVAKLTQALAPHATSIWVACGPGNNGGNGLAAATRLFKDAQKRGLSLNLSVTLAGHPDKLPDEATFALRQARAAGLSLSSTPPPAYDFAIDALLGIGISRPTDGVIAAQLKQLDERNTPLLCVDVPSGLIADTGELLRTESRSFFAGGPRYTLSLLTLKPGLFTAQGRDAAGDIWFEDLSAPPEAALPASSNLSGFPAKSLALDLRHASHKGRRGEVVVIGGQGIDANGTGMTGAAVLAARAALRTGTGRVYLCLLNPVTAMDWDPLQPELMFRTPQAALHEDLLERSVVVCGCGGGQAVMPLLDPVLSRAKTLVLDADALNLIAQNLQYQSLLRQRKDKNSITVIAPHPLEAARLLATSAASVMSDRLAAARALSENFSVICVLKGSGTIVHAPGETPLINPSGHGILATAGTGDVLAGMLGTALATRPDQVTPFISVAQAVFEHGRLAQEWVTHKGSTPLCADQLTQN